MELNKNSVYPKQYIRTVQTAICGLLLNFKWSWSVLKLYPYQGLYLNNREKFQDAKGVFRSRKPKNDRQCNGQKKKDQRTSNDLYNIT